MTSSTSNTLMITFNSRLHLCKKRKDLGRDGRVEKKRRKGGKTSKQRKPRDQRLPPKGVMTV